MNVKALIKEGKTALGIEFGSTRIKGVLTDYDGNVLATGGHEWENALVDGVWTYDLGDVDAGLLHRAAADKLTELLQFNTPLRWSAAHLYQRMLDKEDHVGNVSSVFTLAAYMHYKLTGQKVIGIGDAAGMFPIDSDALEYDEGMVQKFDALAAEHGYSLKLREVFPKVLAVGEQAGTLTAAGAALMDESGNLRPGIPMCPPEGDAGTGMTATNSVAPRTGNLSAGTSTFAMVVLEKQFSKLYREIDMVTPSGFPYAMSHANNGTSDLNAWVGLFREFCALLAAYLADGKKDGKLEDYLDKRIFAGLTGEAVVPTPEEVEGFESFTKHYVAGLDVEKAAITCVNW